MDERRLLFFVCNLLRGGLTPHDVFAQANTFAYYHLLYNSGETDQYGNNYDTKALAMELAAKALVDAHAKLLEEARLANEKRTIGERAL